MLYDKKLKVESDLIRKMELIYKDFEQTNKYKITYEPAKYYVRNVEDLKLALLAAGTKNCLIKAEVIADNSKSRLGQLNSSTVGTYTYLNLDSGVEFNSPSELNLFTRRKKAKIVIEQVYCVYRDYR